MPSKNFIFETQNGKLEFIGDFEGLYKSEENPWGQSGEDKRLEKYYRISRNNLIKNIKQLSNIKLVLEIGCGLGYVTNLLGENIENIKFDGLDISETAIKKAKKLFPNLNFFIGDICNQDFQLNQKYDIVVLNQILWYILKDLKNVFNNIDNLLNKNGYLIISTLFLKEQRYGKDIIGSFDDLISYCINKLDNKYRFINGFIDYENDKDEHRESILIIQKIR